MTVDGRPQATEALWEFGSVQDAARWGRKEGPLQALPFKSIPCSSLPWLWEVLGIPAREAGAGWGGQELSLQHSLCHGCV